MKKRSLAFIMALLVVLAIAGCAGAGSAPRDSAPTSGTSAGGATASSPASYAPESPSADYAEEAGMGDSKGYSYSGNSGGVATENQQAYSLPEYQGSDKIIYSASAQIETQEFDQTLQGVYGMIERFGGFVESSSVTGNDYYTTYYGGKSTRRADFVIRIPREHFSEMTGSLGELGNVPYSSVHAENVTTQYVDTASRLESYRIQEERLLAMLAKAETVEDMLSIEKNLAEVRYNIESLTTTINSWDSLISYSRVSLSVVEVEKYTEENPVQQDYWEELSTALRRSLAGIGEFFKDLFKFVVAALPVLAILAVCTLISLLIIRGTVRRKNAKKETPHEKSDEDK